MTLNSSGTISLGGPITGQSVNLELGQSPTSYITFNDAAVRVLTNTIAGGPIKLPEDFWGKHLAGTTQWWGVSLPASWSGFMNNYAVWVNPDGVNPTGVWVQSTRYVSVGTTGVYYVQGQADNGMSFYVDGVDIIDTSSFLSSTYNTVNLTAGVHLLTFSTYNAGGPAGFAITIAAGNYSDNGGTIIWDTRSNVNP